MRFHKAISPNGLSLARNSVRKRILAQGLYGTSPYASTREVLTFPPHISITIHSSFQNTTVSPRNARYTTTDVS